MNKLPQKVIDVSRRHLDRLIADLRLGVERRVMAFKSRPLDDVRAEAMFLHLKAADKDLPIDRLFMTSFTNNGWERNEVVSSLERLSRRGLIELYFQRSQLWAGVVRVLDL